MVRHQLVDILQRSKNLLTKKLRKNNRLAIFQARREAALDRCNSSFGDNQLYTTIDQIEQQIAKQLETHSAQQIFNGLMNSLETIFIDSQRPILYYNVQNNAQIAPDTTIPNIGQSITEKMVPPLLSYLSRRDSTGKYVILQQIKSYRLESQFTLWIIGFIKIIKKLLNSSEFKVAQFALMTLGYLVSDNYKYRNDMIRLAVLSLMLHLTYKLNKSQKDEKIFKQCQQNLASHLRFYDLRYITPLKDLYHITDRLFIQGTYFLKVNTSALRILENFLFSPVQEAKQRASLALIDKLGGSFFYLGSFHKIIDKRIFNLIGGLAQKQVAKFVIMEKNGILISLIKNPSWSFKTQVRRVLMYRFFNNLIQYGVPAQLYKAYKQKGIVIAFFKLIGNGNIQNQKVSLYCLKDILEFEMNYRKEQRRQFAQQFGSQLKKHPLNNLRNSKTPNGVLFNELIKSFVLQN